MLSIHSASRVEPLPRPRSGHGQGRRQTVAPVKDLEGLGQAGDPTQQRNRLAAQAVRKAAPVPVFIQCANRL